MNGKFRTNKTRTEQKKTTHTHTRKVTSVVKIKFKYIFKLQSIGKVTYGTETNAPQ